MKSKMNLNIDKLKMGLAVASTLALWGCAGSAQQYGDHQHSSGHQQHSYPTASVGVAQADHAAKAASVGGDKKPSARQGIAVTLAERDHVLGDMMKLMGAVSDISAALTENDYKTIAAVAEKLRPEHTMGAQDPDSISFHKKIPAQWRALGGPMHQGFAQIANLASQTQPQGQTIQKVFATTLKQCVACHAQYQLVLQP